ncbi:cysteine desulfurase [PVC group bacterium]|nr:cysteine desulfurase [PVC group bacterium]
MKRIVYLDNAATTKPLPAVIRAVSESMEEDFGNPSSLHNLGVHAQDVFIAAKREIAEFAGLPSEWLIITGGATEANQTVLLHGTRKANKKRNHILMSDIEHPSSREAVGGLKEKGYEVEWMKPDALGVISPESVSQKIRPETELVSIIGIHNEIGVKQDITGIYRAIKSANPQTRFHVDGVQWFAKYSLPGVSHMPDFFTWSSHKFHGPRGIGGIFKRPAISMEPLIRGGGQERGMRSGTENVAGTIGTAAALKGLILEEYQKKMIPLQERIYQSVLSSKDMVWIGPPPGKDRSCFISLFSIVNKKSEVFIHELESQNIFVSSGSACSEKSQKDKTFWKDFSIDARVLDGLIRVSFGLLTTEDDVERFCETVQRLMTKEPAL